MFWAWALAAFCLGWGCGWIHGWIHCNSTRGWQWWCGGIAEGRRLEHDEEERYYEREAALHREAALRRRR